MSWCWLVGHDWAWGRVALWCRRCGEASAYPDPREDLEPW